MKRLGLLIAILVLTSGVAAPSAQAQTSIQLGPRVGIDVGDYGDAFIGADARISTPSLPVIVNPSFDLYFPEAGSFLAISANGLYPFGVSEEPFAPYAGAGLGIYRQSVGDFSSTNLGLNFIFGAKFPTGSFTPFAEAQYSPVFGDDATASLFTIKGGLLFNL